MSRPRRQDEVKGVSGWVRRWWRALLSEVVATALLLCLGCATLVPLAGPGSIVLTHPALTFGLIAVGLFAVFGPISGAHVNPAVSLGALIYGQLEPLVALGYMVAQVLGATIGYAGLLAMSPAELTVGVGVTVPAEGLSPLAAMATEATLTCMLVLTICSVWATHDPARPDTAVPLKVGLVISGLIFSGGHSSGASLNPVRSFPPALLQGVWTHHWVYWVGPMLGGAVAALLHRWVLAERAPRGSVCANTHDAELPLNDP
ncbi:aquaporin-like [Anticarsia gemmatalis]|uniref:aquaporin-like n=1 Tax=Anticarsia gemmatalis TaxID=129554 RepID=UPI003F761AF5